MMCTGVQSADIPYRHCRASTGDVTATISAQSVCDPRRPNISRHRNEGTEEASQYAQAAGRGGVFPAVRAEEGAGQGQVRRGVPGPGQGQQEDLRR